MQNHHTPMQNGSGSPYRFSRRRKAYRGQGIVEYAGAIIVAASVVVAGILTVPPTYNSMFSAVLQNVVDSIPVP